MDRFRCFVVVVVLCTIVLCAACASANNSPYGIFMPPYSDAKRFIDEAVANSFKDKLINQPLPNTVSTVANSIRRKIPLAEVKILRDPSINACSSPGCIYLNQGLVQIASPAELAAILLHEQGHIVHEDLKVRYEQAAKIHDSLARSAAQRGDESANKENVALVESVLPQIIGMFNKDQEFAADFYAWNNLPGIGYPAETMIAFFEKIGGNKKGTMVEKIFSDHPPLNDRMARLKTYKASPVVPASIDFSPFILEIDSAKFLPAFKGEPVEGYAYRDLTDKKGDVFLFLNTDKVKIKKPGFLDYFLSSDPMTADTASRIVLGKATEMVVVLRNTTKDRHFLAFLKLGEDQRAGGIPDKPEKLLVNAEPKHGDWPYNEYIAFMVKLPEIKEKKELILFISTFGRVGDEAFQMTEKSSPTVNRRMVIPLK